MLGVMVSGLVQLPMGYLADRCNRKIMVLVGGLVAGTAVFSFQWASGYAMLMGVCALFGLGGGTAMPALMAVSVFKGHETESMGSVMALLTVAHSLGMLTGALAAGLMMDWYQLRSAFGLGGILIMAGVAVFWYCLQDARIAGVPGVTIDV